jgi:hypothetical protein
MRVFKVADGTSWTARVEDDQPSPAAQRVGWQAVVFQDSVHAAVQRLVYRPPGWLREATPVDLAAALEESVAVRLRWGG